MCVVTAFMFYRLGRTRRAFNYVSQQALMGSTQLLSPTGMNFEAADASVSSFNLVIRAIAAPDRTVCFARTIRSLEKKRDPGFCEQTDPSSPHLSSPFHPPPTSAAVLDGLAVLCLSGLIGLTCSLHMILFRRKCAPLCSRTTRRGHFFPLARRSHSLCIYRNLQSSPRPPSPII